MFEVASSLKAILTEIKKTFNILIGAFWFVIENYRKRYPYVLLGEKKQLSSGSNKDTILLYRISGKRYIFECSASEMCNSKELIGKFHPLDVWIISFIAGIEQVLKVKPEERTEKVERFKEHIFND